MARTSDNEGRLGRRERIVTENMTSAPVEVVGSNSAGIETGSRSVSQVMNIQSDQVRWGPIWAGLLAAFFSLLVLSLLGLAIGASTINAGQAVSGGGGNQNAGQYSAIWAGVSLLLAFLIGGYVAGRTAAVHERGWAGINGGLVFLLALPILLWLVSQGLGTIIGNAGNIAGGLGINLGQQVGSTSGAIRNPTAQQAQQVADTAKNTAWGTLIGLILGYAAAVLGGVLGARTRPARR